jgi:hypothetical protein
MGKNNWILLVLTTNKATFTKESCLTNLYFGLQIIPVKANKTE